MMKTVLTVAAVMMLSACLGQEERQARSSRSLRVECDALFDDFVKASTDYVNGTHKARTPDEARKYTPPDGPTYAARFMSMARAHPDDPVAVDASVRAILVDFYGPYWKEAIERIRARHLKSPRIGDALRGIAYDTTPPEVESLLREVLRENPSAEVRAQAAVALAEHLERLEGEAKNMREHPDRFEGAVQRFGRDYVTRMRDRDMAVMREEEESLLESVIRDYPQVPGPRPGLRDFPSPAEVARRKLRALRALIVGNPAPEIEGKDVDGRPMKLSEYRGKVVVLSFWATWCGPCISMVPHERELVRRMEGKPFVLLGVNGDEDKERLRYRSKELQINWRSFYDGGPHGPISSSSDVHGWPMVVVLDRDGVIRYEGARDEKKLDEAVEELLKSVR